MRVFEEVKRLAMVTAPDLAISLKLSHPTVSSALKVLSDLGVLTEVTGRPRDRRYVYTEYMRLLNEGADSKSGK